MADRLKLSEGEPPFGYSLVGYFNTFMEANRWYLAARKAKNPNPFFCNTTYSQEGSKRFVLWWHKPKSSKMAGKGFGGK